MPLSVSASLPPPLFRTQSRSHPDSSASWYTFPGWRRESLLGTTPGQAGESSLFLMGFGGFNRSLPSAMH